MYSKTLFGIRDVADALQRLEKLTQEEVRMAAAETLKITRDIGDTVKDVDQRLEGVNHKVGSVIEGEPYLQLPLSESVLSLLRG